MDGLRVFESGRKDGWNDCIGDENTHIGGWSGGISGINAPIGGKNAPVGGGESRSGALLFCDLFGTDCR